MYKRLYIRIINNTESTPYGVLSISDAIYMRNIIGLREWIAYGAFVYSNFNLNGMYSLYDNGWLDFPSHLVTYTSDAIWMNVWNFNAERENNCYGNFADKPAAGLSFVVFYYWLDHKSYNDATLIYS